MAASTSFQPGFHSGTCPVRYAVKVNILRMSSNFAFCLVSCGIFCSTSRCAEKKNCSFTALTEGKCFVGEGKPRTGEPRGKGPTKTGLGTGGGSGIDRHTHGGDTRAGWKAELHRLQRVSCPVDSFQFPGRLRTKVSAL